MCGRARLSSDVSEIKVAFRIPPGGQRPILRRAGTWRRPIRFNMSSIAGVKVFAPGGTVYSGTKFAARAISDGLRLEVGPKIRVCSIEPGSIAGIATLEGAAGNT